MAKLEPAILGRNEKIRSAIVSVVYKEPEWKKTRECVMATGVPVVFVERSPEGVGSLTEALNRGYREAVKRYPDLEFVWFVTNVTFVPSLLQTLERAMVNNPDFAIIHPTFVSDHLFCRKIPGLSGVQYVPFVEFTAPLVRRRAFDRVGLLDDKLPYWGQDMDWGCRARRAGFFVGVDQDSEIGHTYIRHTKGGQEVTARRAALRKATDKSTTEELIRIYGPDWAKVLGYQR